MLRNSLNLSLYLGKKKDIRDIYLNRLKDLTKRLSVMHIRTVPSPL